MSDYRHDIGQTTVLTYRQTLEAVYVVAAYERDAIAPVNFPYLC